jgi:hypothetical protein
MRKFIILFFLLFEFFPAYADWWDDAMNAYEDYKTSLYSQGGKIWGWTDQTIGDSRWTGEIGAGFIPPRTKKYNVTSLKLGVDMNADCKGLWLHSNLSALFDIDAMWNWVQSSITNSFYNSLLIALYSNNTIGQLMNFASTFNEQNLSLITQRCNNAEILAVAEDPTYRAMSWSQKLCVNSRMATGSNYADAIRDCAQNAAGAMMGTFAGGDAGIKTCYDIVELDGDEDFIRALLGYFELEYQGGKVSHSYYEPILSAGELMDSLLVKNSAYFDSVLMIYNGTYPGSANQKWEKLQYFMALLSPPGAPVDPSTIKMAGASGPLERASIKNKIVTVSSYAGTVYLVNVAGSFVLECRNNRDFRVLDEEIEKYDEHFKEIKEFLDQAYNEFTVVDGFSRSMGNASAYLYGRAVGRFFEKTSEEANKIGQRVLYSTPSNNRR